MFKVNDIVKVTRNNSIFNKAIGEVGFIKSADVNMAEVITLRLDGSISGHGAIPIYCLDLELGKDWIEAKEKYDKMSEEEITNTIKRIHKCI